MDVREPIQHLRSGARLERIAIAAHYIAHHSDAQDVQITNEGFLVFRHGGLWFSLYDIQSSGTDLERGNAAWVEQLALLSMPM